MSFAADAKTELCRTKLARTCCAQAEVCGVLLYCNQFSPRQVRVITESAAFAQRLPQLFHKAFGIRFDELGEGEGKRVLSIQDPEKCRTLWERCAFDLTGPAHHINFGLLEERCCRLAFLRGAFLAGGSVTDPLKSYHLEFSTNHYNVSRELATLLEELGFPPKSSTRKSNYITYFKHSQSIEELLTALGAPVAAMGLMNTKAEKFLRNGVNRRVNCEAANVGKVVDAAQEQLAAIGRLYELGRVEGLPEKLKETIVLRETYPELSLSELAAEFDPPISKSALSHRLRKLCALAEQ